MTTTRTPHRPNNRRETGRRTRSATLLATIGAIATALLTGCATRPTETTILLNPADYDTAFTAAREALRDERFRLERVDAAQGLITTRPLNTGGFATPLDTEQTTLEDEWQDFIGDRRRVAVITFEPIADRAQANQPQSADRGVALAPARTQTASPQTPLRDLRDPHQRIEANDDQTTSANPAILLRVRVIVERMQQPGVQVSPVAVRRMSRFTDIEWARRGAQAPFPVPVGTDDQLAARITRRIQDTLAKSTTTTDLAANADSASNSSTNNNPG